MNRMHSFLIGFVVIAMTTISAIYTLRLGSVAPPASESALVPDMAERYIGELRQGASAKAHFTLTNRSNDTLYLSRVMPSCHCTAVRLEKERLAPGDTSTLLAQLDAGSIRGDVASRLSIVYYGENNRFAKILDLTVRARVLPDYEYRPYPLIFHRGSSEQRRISFWRPKNSPLQELHIKDFYCTHDAFAVRRLTSTSPQSANGRTFELLFDADRWADGDEFAQFVLHTNSEAEPVCRLDLVVLK